MPPENLSGDLVAILEKIRDEGGTDCSGSCHHRKPGEFHCHYIAQELRISSSGVKRRILELVRLGMLERNRLDRSGTYPLTRFTITDVGHRALESRAKGKDQ